MASWSDDAYRDNRDALEHRDAVDEWFAGEPADTGSVVDVIRRACAAQQAHDRRIDVQLDLADGN